VRLNSVFFYVSIINRIIKSCIVEVDDWKCQFPVLIEMRNRLEEFSLEMSSDEYYNQKKIVNANSEKDGLQAESSITPILPDDQ